MSILATAKQYCRNCGEFAIGACDECKKPLCSDCALLLHVSGREQGNTDIFGGNALSVIHSLHGDEFPWREDVLLRIVGELGSEPNILCKADALKKMKPHERNALRAWWLVAKRYSWYLCGTCNSPTVRYCMYCGSSQCMQCLVLGSDQFPGRDEVIAELAWDEKRAICQGCISASLVSSLHKQAFAEWWNEHKTAVRS